MAGSSSTTRIRRAAGEVSALVAIGGRIERPGWRPTPPAARWCPGTIGLRPRQLLGGRKLRVARQLPLDLVDQVVVQLEVASQEADRDLQILFAVGQPRGAALGVVQPLLDRKSTRLNSSHTVISYAVFCLEK